MAGPKLTLSGKQAMEAVAKILPTAHSITVNSSMGAVELKPGTVWSGNRMLFYCAPMYVWYTIDDRAYEWGTGDFIREEWLSALSAGAQRASGMVTLAKAEFALLSGIFVPWYVLLGLGCAKVGLFYASNKLTVDKAMAQAPKVIELLQDLKRRSPTLFGKLMSTAVREVITNIPSGLSAEDVAFFVGRLIKGAAGAGPELTLGALLKVVAKVAGIVTATHLPGMAARGVGQAAGQRAAELRQQLAAVGMAVTDAEAKAIVSEITSKSDSAAKLQQLEAACKALMPSLEVLKRAYGTMS